VAGDTSNVKAPETSLEGMRERGMGIKTSITFTITLVSLVIVAVSGWFEYGKSTPTQAEIIKVAKLEQQVISLSSAANHLAESYRYSERRLPYKRTYEPREKNEQQYKKSRSHASYS